jgi:hypothetical protein
LQRTVVKQEFLVQGTVEQFDKGAFTSALAAVAGLPHTSFVSVRISAASVRVVATLSAAPGISISSVQASLTALASSGAANASSVLGVMVEALDVPVVVTEADDPLSGAEQSVDFNVITIAVSVGAGALILLAVAAFRWQRRASASSVARLGESRALPRKAASAEPEGSVTV